MEKPAKKRGRPPITKEYTNPLESPMAHSSMKVRKLGPQNFSRPLMKVGQFTPSPRNRRTSSSSSSSGSDSANLLGPGSTTKKGRYRGVILSTPTKRPNSSSNPVTCTPSSTPSTNDSIFHSTSRMTLKSSPPISTSPLLASGGAKRMSYCDTAQQFKFALTIGENGRATIAGSSPISSPSKVNIQPPKELKSGEPDDNSSVSGLQNSTSTYEKKRVLSLLKRMRNNTTNSNNNRDSTKYCGGVDQSSNDKVTTALVQNEVSSSNELPFSPNFKALSNNSNQFAANLSVPKSPQPPSTPRTSFAMRTGFTPNVGIDQVLLDIVSSPKAGLIAGNDSHIINFGHPSNIITLSPKSRSTSRSTGSQQQQQQQQQLQQQQEQQFVFKFSSADPLLLTDDVEGNWSEVIYNHLQASPRHQICFNTPPSWMNLGSPRAFSPQRQDSNTILISACQSSGGELQTEGRSNNIRAHNGILNINSSPPRSSTSGGLSHKAPALNSTDKYMPEPSTPRAQEFIPAIIECTPLIQQTMNGSLTSKCLPGMLSVGGMTDLGKEPTKSMSAGIEQEDARAALKKLIAER